MKPIVSPTKVVFTLMLIVFIIGFSAFRQQQKGPSNSFRKQSNEYATDDTTPSRQRSEHTISNMAQLEAAMQTLQLQMKVPETKWDKFNFSGINKEVNASLQKIDFNRMQNDIEKSIKNNEWSKMHKMTESKLQQHHLADVHKHLEFIQHQFEAKHIAFDHDKIEAEVKLSMAKAGASIQKVRAEMKRIHTLINVLQADGLIDTNKGYRLEVKDGELFINGKKQAKEVNEKYQQHYQKKNFTINTTDKEHI